MQIAKVYKIMFDSQGYYPPHNCQSCNTPLMGENSGRPAELYAGTYTGLCYKCQSKPSAVIYVHPLDECQKISYPPHNPAWRRDRETFLAYADCSECKGAGMILQPYNPDTWSCSYEQCDSCLERYYANPIRKAYHDELASVRRHLNDEQMRLYQEAVLVVAQEFGLEIVYPKFARGKNKGQYNTKEQPLGVILPNEKEDKDQYDLVANRYRELGLPYLQLSFELRKAVAENHQSAYMDIYELKEFVFLDK